MRSLKSCDNEFCDIYSLTLNMPMDADFAIAFVAGNIDRDSRIKKKFIPKSQLGQGINIFVKIFVVIRIGHVKHTNPACRRACMMRMRQYICVA